MGERLLRALGADAELWASINPFSREAGPARRTLSFATACYAGVTNALGLPLRPVPCAPGQGHYEAVLLFRGEVAFRPTCPHDWFNLLSWRAWPRAKAALNLRHALHYLSQLGRHHRDDALLRRFYRVPRDRWMQSLADLDEGGSVASRALLATKAEPDGRGALRFTCDPEDQALAAGFRWFGHAVLEHLFEGRPTPRSFIAPLIEVSDEALARQVLTLDPTLAAPLAPILDDWPRGAPAPLPFYRTALRFADEDLFRKPTLSARPPFGPSANAEHQR